MEQNTVTINQLIAQILDEMRRIGYSETTIWRYYQPAMGQFRKYYVQTGQAAYSPEITDEYISLNKERYERGEVTYQSFKKTRYVGRRMNEFFLSGQFRYTSQKRGTSFMLSEGNERIVDQFLCSRSCGDKSRYDAGWTVRKYLQYMEKRGHKSRSIVMSEDMRAVVRSYAAMRDASFPENGYFFPRPDGSPYTAAWMGGKFRKFFARSKKDEPSELLPPVRVYDLRHRFATANLSRWLDRGIDIHSRLPYLQAYMGHKELAATAYYIHLLPENLVRSSGIDWDSMNRLVPEVELWER